MISANQLNIRENKMTTNTEQYITFAFDWGIHKNKEFLEYFKNKDKRIYNNYIRINKEKKTKEGFEANPLVFILMNEPKCCLNIAKEFIDMYINENKEHKKEQIINNNDTDYETLFFEEYKRLGGQRGRKSYDKISEEYVKHNMYTTTSASICLENEDDIPYKDHHGYWVYYDRKTAEEGFTKATNCKDTWRIAQSIDNICVFT